MSLIFEPNSARLSVIGNGWNNVSFDSGNGFVFDDELWRDLAFDLNFEFDPNLDFGELELPEFDFSDIIFDLDGTIYTEMDGVWKNPLTGAVYPGGGTRWISEDRLISSAGRLSNNAHYYDYYMNKWVIPQSVIDGMMEKMQKVQSIEIEDASVSVTHSIVAEFDPSVWIYWARNQLWAILGEKFKRKVYRFGTVPQYIENHTFLGYSMPPVCISQVSVKKEKILNAMLDNGKILYRDNGLLDIMPELPEEYFLNDSDASIQLLYGSYAPYVKEKYGDFVKTDATITADKIRNGTSGLESREYGGKTYYKV